MLPQQGCRSVKRRPEKAPQHSLLLRRTAVLHVLFGNKPAVAAQRRLTNAVLALEAVRVRRQLRCAVRVVLNSSGRVVNVSAALAIASRPGWEEKSNVNRKSPQNLQTNK